VLLLVENDGLAEVGGTQVRFALTGGLSNHSLIKSSFLDVDAKLTQSS
jgi:hypothetical protein